MQARQPLVFHLHAHVSPGNHDAVRMAQNLVEIVDALYVLYFCNNFDSLAAVVVQKIPHVDDVLLGADKGCRNIVHVVLHCEQQVCLVLFAQIGHVQMDVGHVNPLVV